MSEPKTAGEAAARAWYAASGIGERATSDILATKEDWSAWEAAAKAVLEFSAGVRPAMTDSDLHRAHAEEAGLTVQTSDTRQQTLFERERETMPDFGKLAEGDYEDE